MWNLLKINSNIIFGVYMGLIIELIKFLSVKKKLWLLPLFIILIVIGGLLVIAQGSVLAPFIYTLF